LGEVSRLEGSQPWQRHRVALPQVSKNVVYRAVNLVGGTGRRQLRTTRKLPGEIALFHSDQSLNPRKTPERHFGRDKLQYVVETVPDGIRQEKP